MTLQDLERLAFLLHSRAALPDVLTVPWAAAIVNCLHDPAGRSLDYWLALPPRARQADLNFLKQRNNLYQNLAGTMSGSTHSQAQIIAADLEIWLEGESSADSFGRSFETFLREYRELEVPHLRQTALRSIITAESCQTVATGLGTPGV